MQRGWPYTTRGSCALLTGNLCGCVMESNLVLLATWQANKFERRSIGGKNRDFIQKASRWRICQTSIPKNHLTQVRIQASFILKGEEVWLAVINFLVSESFILAAIHVGQVTMFLQTSNKCYSLSWKFLSLYEWKTVTLLKIRALRRALLYISDIGNTLNL